MPYFEDIKIGTRRELGSFTFLADDIKKFAAKFDPQPFHLDEEAAKKTIGVKPSCVATARWASSSWPKPSPSHACFPPSCMSWVVLLLVRHSTGRMADRIASRHTPSPPSEAGPLLSHSDQDDRGRPNGGCSVDGDRRIGRRVVRSPSAPQTLSADCKNRHRSSKYPRASLSSSIAG